MKTRVMKVMLLLLISMVGISVQAYDFEASGLYYNILSGNTVELTFKKSTAYQGNIVIPSKVKNGAQEYTVVSIGAKAFCRISSVNSDGTANDYGSNSYVQSVTIPNTVVSIGDHAFYGCNGLTSVTFSSSLKSIGEYAFQFCTALPSLTIPNSVTTIGEYAFQFCTGLTSVDISTSLTALENGVFDSCSGLVSLVIPNSVTRIGNEVFFSCEGLVSLIIPNSVTIIGNDAFSGCTNLSSITFPSSVTSIGENIFAWCNNLNSVKVETGNTKYDSRNDCNAIIETASNTLIAGCKKTIIPSTVTSIGESAFSWCSDLSSITIPNSVSEIGEYAFYQCTDLKGITCFISHPFAISTNCWGDVDKSIPLYVPQGTKSLYQNTDGWKEFTNIIEMDSSEPSTPTTTTEQGPNYLQIWFKDGHTERHLLSLVKSISATKYDINGILHSNYQMQQIVMEDTTYSYNISDIDNMSFRKVDKEEAKQNIIEARTFIDPIFEQCSSVEDMEQHLSEIRNLANVEDAYSTGNDIVVQVKDWRIMTYHFHEYEDEEDLSAKANSIRSALQGLKKTRKAQSADNPLKAVIYFQMENDHARTFPIFGQKNILKDIQSDLEDAGILVKFIPQDGSDEVDKFADFDFFENGIYDYDIVFLETHGNSGKDWFGRHWICTRSQYNKSEEDSIIDEKYDYGEASIAVCKGIIEEDLLFKESVTYWQISEDFIKNSAKSFYRNNPRIVFNTSCHSLDELQESDVIDDKHIGSSIYSRGNDSFAQAFIAKGADIYIGYNQSSYLGAKTGELFFKSMLNGCSEAKAFVDLPDNKKKETGYYESAELIDIVSSSYADYLQNQDRRSVFIIKNKTSEISAIDLLSYNTTGKLPLHGTTTMIDPEESDVRCGFKYSIDGVDYPVLFCDKVIDKNKNADNVSFSASIDLKPGQTISYRSVTYDDVYFNYGEIRQFTVPGAVSLALSTTSLEVSVGSSSTVEITSGSGEYGVTNLNSSIARGTLQGTTVTINALAEGDAKVVVTDMQSGQQIIIEITVTAGSDVAVYLSCPDNNHPHIIDMGVAGKWACCNVGAKSPKELGGFYAWGETEQKSSYNWSTYMHCDGSRETCHDIGDEIANTDYDVASVNWGKSWHMPSRKQIQLLLDSCSREVIDLCVKFTAPNGGSIFLPKMRTTTNYHWNTDIYFGTYWSSSLDQDNSYNAYVIDFSFNPNYGWTQWVLSIGMGSSSRCEKLCVRPVYE